MPLSTSEVISNTPESSPRANSKALSQSQLDQLSPTKPATGQAISISAKAIANHFNQQQASTTLQHCLAQQPPLQETDSGGIRAMLSKFGSLKALPQLLTAIACPARVKRHNTSSWITGRIRSEDYRLAKVPIDVIRSQHSIDGVAIEKTAQRASCILEWLKSNPTEKTIDLQTINLLAGSSGALKVGCAAQDRIITLDGVGRVEAIRQALESHRLETGHDHPLEHVECYVTRLKDDEYESLYKTSRYFRDDAGTQLEAPEHDLMPYSGLPRLLAGQTMNLARQSIESSLSSLSDQFDRRIPEHYFSEPPAQR